MAEPLTSEPVPEVGPAEGTSKARFVWPPRPVVVETLPPVNEECEARYRSLVVSPERVPAARFDWLHEIERVWMGMSREPWAARAASAGWEPDDLAEFCPRCATTVGPHELSRDDDVPVCPACCGKRLPWVRAVRLGDYDGLLRDAIHEVKFTRWRALGRELGRMLGQQVALALAAAGVDLSHVVLVPVPTTLRRRLRRGIDHTLVITRAAREVLDCRLVPALARRHRPSQLDVPPSQRQANVAGAFRPRSRLRPSGATIVVVDDVRTTGATMTAACRAILAGQRRSTPGNESGDRARVLNPVWTAVLGVTPDPARRGQTGRQEESREVSRAGN